jgi:hypothetical protein
MAPTIDLMQRSRELRAVVTVVTALVGFGCSETSPGRDGGTSDLPVGLEARVGDLLSPRDKGPPGEKGALADKRADQPATWTGYFPPTSVWYLDHSGATVHPKSAAIINWLSNAGGWGSGQLRIDFSIEVLSADASTPMKTFTPTGDFYSPDCDHVAMPVPAGGALEGETGYQCVNDGDCHLIVVHKPSKKLYEMWRADIQGTTFNGGCLAVWDMSRVYGPTGRGDQCTSADAAGFPIAPLLFSADEVKAGVIPHAIRFILPNSRIRSKVFVRPATHSTNATSGGADAPQYGVHLRLKAATDVSALKAGAKVVAQALKKHGMFLADGGTIALTAQSDRFTAAKWSGLLGAYDLSSLKVTDFEVVDHGADISYTGNCIRNP